MKFVLCYRLRDGGSVDERIAGGESAQKLLANWAPSDKATVHAWVQRCDGSGGFAFIENDDETELYRDIALWAPWLDFDVVPVLDITDATPIQDEVLGRARSVT